jgi:hypothetical protein
MITPMLENRIKHFNQTIQSSSIEEYFAINNNTNNTKSNIITFELSIIDSIEKIDINTYQPNLINFNIKFKSNPKFYYFNKLPLVLNHIIASYNYDKIEINLRILFPLKYPFTYPIWELINIKSNINPDIINISEYYKYIVDSHNKDYQKNWSPAICIEKDLIYFISKVNYFEYIVDPNY